MIDWLNKDFNETYGTTLGLNKFLMSTASPINPDPEQNYAFKFDSENERDSINNVIIRNLSANKIVSGTIISGIVYAGTLTGNQINGGTLTLGGTANGNGVMEVKLASGTTVIRGDNLGHHYYTDSGTEQIRVDEDGLTAYKTDGTTPQFALTRDGFYSFGTITDLIKFKTSSISTTTFGEFGYSPNDYWGTSCLYISATGDLANICTEKAMFQGSKAAILFASDTTGTAEVLSAGPVSIGAPNGGKDVEITAGDDISLAAGDNIDLSCSGNFILNGATKTAIVRTKDEYRALYAMESPSVWFMDFIPNMGQADPMFIDVTEPPYHYIKCEDGFYQMWGKRKGLGTVRFEKKTGEEFSNNNLLYSGRTTQATRDLINKRLEELRTRLKPIDQVADLNTKLDNKEVIK